MLGFAVRKRRLTNGKGSRAKVGIMITTSSFLTGTLSTVDEVIGTFVDLAYHNLIQNNAEVITLVFTLYVILQGYRFLSHSSTADLATIMRQLIVMLCVYSLVMRWNLYNLLIYKIFTNEPGNIATTLVNSTGHMSPDSNVYQTLDTIYGLVIKSTREFFGLGGLSKDGMCFFLYGLLVFIIGTILCVIALLLFIYSKMVMAVALALGPLFILFILFDATKAMFGAWLNKLMTTALIPIVTSAILVLMLSVIKVTLPQLATPPEANYFSGIAPFLGLSLATSLVLSQVLSICSSLGGGITLAGLSKGVDIAKSAMEKSGVIRAGEKAAHFSRRGMYKIQNRMLRRKAS